MHDTHVRYPEDPGPLVGGQGHLRYTLCDRNDPDVVRIRQDIPHDGKGLFVARLGDTGVKALIEAYYPEDIRSAYVAHQLDRYRVMDYKMGRLVAIAEIFKWIGEIDQRRITEIQRNARNVHSELKRNHDAGSHKIALDDGIAAGQEEALDNWMDFYADAYMNTVEFASGKPRVSAYNPTRR